MTTKYKKGTVCLIVGLPAVGSDLTELLGTQVTVGEHVEQDPEEGLCQEVIDSSNKGIKWAIQHLEPKSERFIWPISMLMPISDHQPTEQEITEELDA